MKIGDKIEISGEIISFDELGNIKLGFNEILLEGEWKKFSPQKSMDIVSKDYTKELTAQELALVKTLIESNKNSTSLNPDEKILANSIISKLEN